MVLRLQRFRDFSAQEDQDARGDSDAQRPFNLPEVRNGWAVMWSKSCDGNNILAEGWIGFTKDLFEIAHRRPRKGHRWARGWKPHAYTHPGQSFLPGSVGVQIQTCCQQ